MRQTTFKGVENPLNIMLLDDGTDVLDALKSQLTRGSYSCISTCDYREAIETIKNASPKVDMLIIDYLMIGTTVIQVAEEIRSFNRELYIILLTGYANNMPGKIALRSLDIDSYSIKSIDYEDLMLKIEIGAKSIKRMKISRQTYGSTFEERLKNLRISQGKTQDDVAEYLGVGRTTVCAYEAGTIRPGFENILKLVEFFKISYDELFR